MQLAMCQICKYPVWSYICPDCLAKGIAGWIPSRLSAEFRRFSRFFLSHFSSTESNLTRVRCIHCHSLKETTLCSFCYITEVFRWMKEREPALARTILRALPIKPGSMREWNSADSLSVMPISFENTGTDEGICEECGEFSETNLFNGKWLCSGCREYEK